MLRQRNLLKLGAWLIVVGIVGVLFILGIVVGGYLWKPLVTAGGGLSSNAPAVGGLAPDFELASLAGDQVKLSDLRGQPVMINFWATWCSPCTAEMPVIQSRYARYAPNLHVLAVDVGETGSMVGAFVDRNGLTFDILLDSNNKISDLYGVTAFPTTFFVNSEGYIREVVVGSMSESELDEYLKGIGLAP